MKKKHHELYICVLLNALSALASLLLPAYISQCLLYGIVFCFVYILIAAYRKKEYLKCRIAGAAVIIASALMYILIPSVTALYCFRTACMILYIWETYALLKDTSDVWKKTFLDDKMTYLFRMVVALVLLITGCMFTLYELYPERFLMHMTAADYEADRPEKYAGKYDVQYGISYESVYPEGSFDLIMPEGEPSGTVIWLHGGGHMRQDKYTGMNRTLITNMLEEGYAAVMMDYSVTTCFPSMNIQLEELVSFLREKGSEYSLNTSKFILAGTGCGADTVMQYALCVCEPAYADKNHLTASLSPEDIVCLYLCSALYCPEKGAETDLILSDYTAAEQLRNYYGVIDLQSSAKLKDLNVLPYIHDGFVPVFFSEGNAGTYTEQAHIFEDVLEDTDVIYEAHIFDSVSDKRELVYMSFDCTNNHFTAAVNGAFITFLRDIQGH